MKIKKWRIGILIILAIVVIVVVVIVIGKSGNSKTNEIASIKVEKRNIIEKALAVGTIGPETEISIKSKISGVVNKLLVEAGSYVKAGESLIEIRPDPTPLELAEAKRNVEIVS